jgi:hypothetical protein
MLRYLQKVKLFLLKRIRTAIDNPEEHRPFHTSDSEPEGHQRHQSLPLLDTSELYYIFILIDWIPPSPFKSTYATGKEPTAFPS